MPVRADRKAACLLGAQKRTYAFAAICSLENRAASTPERTRRRKMSIRTIFALSAAIVLSTAATASAATKKQKIPRGGAQAHDRADAVV